MKISASAMLATVVLAGCKSPQPRPPVEPPPESVPTYEALRQSEQTRLSALSEMHSYGSLELTWQDDDGDHFESVDLQLAIWRPDRTAVRIRKLGDDYLWLGSDGTDYWLFDLRDRDASVAYVGSFDKVDQRRRIAGVLHPMTMVDLMALTPLPEEPTKVIFDAAEDAWMIETTGLGGAIRVFFDRRTLFPLRIDSLDAEGGIAATSRLEKYQAVEVIGVPDGGWPSIAHRIRIKDMSGQDGVVVHLDQPEGFLNDQQKNGLFDLDRIMQYLGPARVERDGESE